VAFLLINFAVMIPIEQLYALFLRHPSVCTDSRKLKSGDIFFALKGDRFNGNAFAPQALREGAAYAVIDEMPQTLHEQYILVDDVLATLQALAGHHRSQFTIPFIAITGSNGKTTTKELIHAVLSSTYRTYTTEGNLNNHIGIPLTILKIKSDAEMAVIEMGANHLREIAGYCTYTRPTHGLVTNVGKAHLEGFGSPEAVRQGKGELYDWLRTHHGTAFVMWDYPYLRDMSQGIAEIVSYGSSDATVTGVAEGNDPLLRVRLTPGADREEIQTRLAGKYNLPNVLAAVTVGRYFQVPFIKVKSSLEAYEPSNSRSQILTWNDNTVLLDAYNANPSSMKLAIDNFVSFSAGDKVLVLGAMAEMGAASLGEHEEILRQIAAHPWKAVILVGGDFLKIKNPYHQFRTSAEAGEWLKSQHFRNTAFLVKGSRSTQMEKVLQ
jgi:UDP-N-acetylmuramoyl-tripeptide--D-alanyl-D-alanine ligase